MNDTTSNNLTTIRVCLPLAIVSFIVFIGEFLFEKTSYAVSLSSFAIFAFLGGLIINMMTTDKVTLSKQYEIDQISREKEALTNIHLGLHRITVEKKLKDKVAFAMRIIAEELPSQTFVFYSCQNQDISFMAAAKQTSTGITRNITSDDPLILEINSKLSALTDYESLKQSGGLSKPIEIQQEDKYLGQIIPVALYTQVFGVLVIVGEKPSDLQNTLTSNFCDSLALLIDNHKTYNSALNGDTQEGSTVSMKNESEELAENLYSTMFTEKLPVTVSWNIAQFYYPSDNRADFLDVINVSSDRYMLFYGKCSCGGIKAALYISKLKLLFRCFINECPTPAELLNKVSTYMNSDIMPDIFVDMIALTYGSFDTNVVLAMAGNTMPIINRTRSGYAEIPQLESGIPLGLFNQGTEPYKNQHLNIMPGDGILIHTDGITGFPDGNIDRINNEDLKLILDSIPEQDASTMLDAIVKQISPDTSDGVPEVDHSIIYLKAE